MTTVFDSLPQPVREKAEARAVELGLPADDLFLLTLIEDEAERRKALETILLESLNSGPGIEVTDEYWDDLLRKHEGRMQGIRAAAHDATV